MGRTDRAAEPLMKPEEEEWLSEPQERRKFMFTYFLRIVPLKSYQFFSGVLPAFYSHVPN